MKESNTNDYPDIIGMAVIKDDKAFDTPINYHIGYIVTDDHDQIQVVFDRKFTHDSCVWVYAKDYDVLRLNKEGGIIGSEKN